MRKESALTADGRAQRWAIHQKPHEFYAPYGEHYWHMCPGCREWQEHLAAVCARLLRETGADGIRLDSHGFHWTPCYNPAHEHKHPFQWNEGLRQLLRMVHAAMTSVNPNAILETESLVDFFHESCAAALSQSAPGSDVSPVRVALPTYRVFDYAGNALDAFLYGSTQFRSTVPGIDLRLRTAELHHTFASALVSGALITPEPQASQPGWDCRLWRGDGYCLLTAAHLAGFQGSYPALDPAPVSALVVTLPSEAREIGLAYRVDAQTLEVAASPSAATGTGRTVVLDRPCCAVFLPFPHGPSLLTATATTPLRAGESTTLRLALAGRPTGAEPVRVVVSAPGLRVNGQPMTEAVLPAMVKITVPEDTEPGIYFLTARGRGVLPIKRFLEVTP